MSRASQDLTNTHPRAQLAAAVAWCLEWGMVVIAMMLALRIIAHPVDETFNVFVLTVAVAMLTAWIMVQDLKFLTIADGATVSMAFLAFAYRWSESDTLIAMAVDCLLTGGVLLAFREVYFRMRGVDGLGLGDVKLAAAGGMLIGANAFPWALMGASLTTLGFAISNRAFVESSRPDSSNKLAFGAILAPTIWITWVAEQAAVLFSFGFGS